MRFNKYGVEVTHLPSMWKPGDLQIHEGQMKCDDFNPKWTPMKYSLRQTVETWKTYGQGVFILGG